LAPLQLGYSGAMKCLVTQGLGADKMLVGKAALKTTAPLGLLLLLCWYLFLFINPELLAGSANIHRI